MKKVTLLLLLLAGCAAQVQVAEPQDAGSPAPAAAPAPLLVEIEDTPLAEVYGPDSGPEADAGASVHERYFGDSGWDCCWSDLCAVVCERRGGVAATDGLHTCCVPDVGQCDGADAGL